MIYIPEKAGKAMLLSGNRHWNEDLTEKLDIAIRDAGFQVWSVESKIVPYDVDGCIAPACVEWECLGAYMGTLQALFDFHYRRKKKPTSPAQYIGALKSRRLGKLPHACLFEVDGEGMGRSGYAALAANEGSQRSMISLSCGDGWGEGCVFAVVEE